jgi:TonB family protein
MASFAPRSDTKIHTPEACLVAETLKLARTGHILAVALERPSGSAAFDRAALAAATATTFTSAAKGCVAVDTMFRYVVARDDSHQLTAVVLPRK